MPIIIQDYTWRQTQDLIIVRVPLRGVHQSKVDIFTSDTFIKASFPPYLYETCLYETIDERWSRCVLAGEEAIFELKKHKLKKWPCLNKDLPRDELLQIKKNAIDRAHEKAAEDKKKKAEVKELKRRESVREQIVLDSKLREGIEKIKTKERDNATKEIELWKKTKAYDNPKLLFKDKSSSSEVGQDIFGEEDLKRSGKVEILSKPKQIEILTKPKPEPPKIPEPRKCATIQFTFTERSFPTPSRESRLPEEQEWLKKQAEARRATGFMVEDLRPEENDPQWLLDKGQSFLDVGNYLGAISAFTHGIKLAEKMPELYVARSSAQLAVGNVRRVVRDTSLALDLLKPEVEGNSEMRFRSRYNRGEALVRLGLARAAEADLEEALRLRPGHPEATALYYKAELMDDVPEEIPPVSRLRPSDIQ